MSGAESILSAVVWGLVTSVGPCVAPRYIAIIGMCAGETWPTRTRVLGAFTTGTLIGYLALANTTFMLRHILAVSSFFYLAMAVALCVSAVVTILRAERHQCAARDRTSKSFGGSFMLGLSSSLVLSPCCAPMIAGFGAYGIATLSTSVLVVAFCMGHFAPLVAATLSSHVLTLSKEATQASAIVSAGLLASMGAYYALLA